MVAMHAGDGHAGDGHASPSMHVEDRNLSWKYVAQIAGNGVSGLQIFQGSMPLDSLVKRGSAATVHRRGVRRNLLLMKTVNGARQEVNEMIVF